MVIVAVIAGVLLTLGSVAPVAQANSNDGWQAPWDDTSIQNPWDIMKLGLQPVKKTGYGLDTGDAPPSILDSVMYGVRVFLGVIGIILVVIIVYAGFRWMTAGGNEEQVTEARGWLRNAAIGLFIIVMAYTITIFITNVYYQSTLLPS